MKKLLILLLGVLTFAALLTCTALADDQYTTGAVTHSFADDGKTHQYTATCSEDIVPGNQYVLLVVKTNAPDHPIVGERTIMYIDQQEATSGTVTFENFVPRSTPDCVVLLGGQFDGGTSPRTLGTIKSQGATVSGSVTSYGSATDPVTVTLTGAGFTGSVEADGSYTFGSVPAGTYTLTVSKSKHVTREYTVTVEGSDVTKNVEVLLYGDVNGDGKINGVDVLQINRKIANLSSILNVGTEEEIAYRFKVANVTAVTTGDSVLNGIDVLQINRKIANLSSAFDRIP